jgi:GTP-binding protein
LLNKSDLLPPADAAARAKDIVRRLRFRGPHFLISGATGAGTPELVQAVMTFLEQNQRAADAAADD